MTSLALRRLGYLLVGTAIVLVAAAAVAPRLVDWDSYRSSFAAAARQATGRHVVIAGDIRLSIFPTPTLALGDVRVANVPGAVSPELVRAARVEIRLAPMALLSGRVEPRSIRVARPVVMLEILTDGRWNWSEAASRALEADGDTRLAGGIAELVVEDATVVRRQRSGGTTEIVSRVSATIERRNGAGPYRSAGGFRARGIDMDFDGSLGPFASGAPTPVRLSLWRREAPVRLFFAGQLDDTAEGSGLVGTFRGEGADLSALVAMVSGLDLQAAPAALAGEFALDGRLSFVADRAELNAISITLGDLRVSGAGAVHFGDRVETELALAVQSINVDRLRGIDGIGRRGTVRATLPGLPGASWHAREFLIDLLDQTRDLPVSVDVTVAAMIYNGRLVRDLHLVANLGGGEAAVSEISASLPGGATVLVTGRLRNRGETPEFDGAVDARASNLRGMLEWLGAAPLDAPADRLRGARLAGQVTARLDRLAIREAQLDLDVSRVQGDFVANWAGRTAYRVKVEVDSIDLGAYRSSGVGTALLALTEFDADLDARVGRLLVGGAKFVDAHVDAILQNGIFTLRRFAFDDPDGIRASASGSLRQLIAAPVIDLAFEIDTAAPALWSVVSRPAPLWSTRVGRIGAVGRISGELADATMTVKTSVAGGRVELGGGIRLSLSGPRYELDIAGHDLDPWRIARVFEPGLKAEKATGDRLSLSAVVSGGLEEVTVSNLAATAGTVAATGKLSVDLRPAIPRITGRIETGGMALEQVLALPLATTGAVPPAGSAQDAGANPTWTRTPIVGLSSREVQAEIELVPDFLAIDGARIERPRLVIEMGSAGLGVSRLTGMLFRGELSASARLGAQRAPKVAAAFALNGADLVEALPRIGEFESVGGRFDAAIDLTATGGSVIEMMSTLAGTGRIVAERVVLKGFDLNAVNDRVRDRSRPLGTIDLLLAGRGEGLTRMQTIEGTFTAAGGRIRSDDLAAIADGGRLSGEVVLILRRREIEATMRIALAATPDAPPLLVKLRGPLEAPDVVLEFEAFQEYLVRTPPPRQPGGGAR